MSYTTSDLTALETAIAAGKTEVRIGDMLVKFGTVQDLQRRYEIVRGALQAAGSIAPPATANARTALMAHSRD